MKMKKKIVSEKNTSHCPDTTEDNALNIILSLAKEQ